MSFTLHAQLAEDTLEVTRLDICQVLLMNDSRYPWIILVPQRPNIVELHELSLGDYTQVQREIRCASLALNEQANPHKINIGALGNMVSQLHIHVIARQPNDSAWPQPVWGLGKPIPYTEEAARAEVTSLKAAMVKHYQI